MFNQIKTSAKNTAEPKIKNMIGFDQTIVSSLIKNSPIMLLPCLILCRHKHNHSLALLYQVEANAST